MPEPSAARGYPETVTETGPGLAPLSVSSEAIADPGSLIALLEPRHPLAFLRGGDGIVGFGAALRLEFSGPTRVQDAAAAWRRVVATSTVTDAVGLAGSGLVALCSFAFSDRSAATSVLVVPSIIVGRRDGAAWITRVNTAADQPKAEPIGQEYAATMTPGSLAPREYAAAVAAAVKRIAAGELSKVVLARDLVGAIPETADLRLPLHRLANAYPDTFTFAVDGLIGSSPETLVRASGGIVSARVLAGSAARGEDAAADARAAAAITASAKDLAEHAFAVASVMASLAERTTGLTASTAPFPLALPNLWHLASDVSGTLTDDASSLDLVAAVHPTAAVAGSPTPAAVAAIAELEPFDRGRYAGPVGWVDGNGDGEWAIALRCAQVTGTEVRAFAGAGIVGGSDPAQELAETALKFRPVTEAFG